MIMTTHAERRIERKIPTVVKASDHFRRYRKEENHEVRNSEVQENKIVQQLKEAWSKFTYKSTAIRGVLEDDYQRAVNIIKSINYSSEDVERFSLVLAQFQDEEHFSYSTGLFLSALINCGSEQTYTIHTNHLQENIDYLGYKNTKNIIVKGSVNYDLGFEMLSGSIVVEGDANKDGVGVCLKGGTIIINGNALGHVGNEMRGGEIIIKGSAGNYVGNKMKGGKILVKGNVGDHVGFYMKDGHIAIDGNVGIYLGECMRGGAIIVGGNVEDHIGFEMNGGEIHLNGNYEHISNTIDGGKIYHKGTLIYGAGRRVDE